MPAINHIPIPELYVSQDAAEKLRDEACKLPKWELNPSQLRDLELLMNGGFFPLKGFMTQADCDSVTHDLRLTSGAIWPVPVVLDISDDFAARIEPGDDIALTQSGTCLAIMSVTDHWQRGDSIALGGKVKGLQPPKNAGDSPNQLRKILSERGLEQVTYRHSIEDDGAVLTFTGPDASELAKIELPLHDQMQILLGLVARNYGATHFPDHGDTEINQALEAVGLTIIG